MQRKFNKERWEMAQERMRLIIEGPDIVKPVTDDNLFHDFLDHVRDCTKRVMENANATIQMYGELLSPGEQYPYSEVVMQHRLENERLLESIIRTFLSTDEMEIYMSRFGAKMKGFDEIDSCQDMSSPQKCAEFSALCAKVVSACDNMVYYDPTLRLSALMHYKTALGTLDVQQSPLEPVNLNIDEEYVKAYCQRYSGKGIDFDELFSQAQEGIRRATARYDPTHITAYPYSFQMYALVWIKERIHQRFKDMKKMKEAMKDEKWYD